MVHRITAQNSQFVTTGNAFTGNTVLGDSLIVDADAFLISDSSTNPGHGAQLSGSWTVRVAGLLAGVGLYDPGHSEPVGLSLLANAPSDHTKVIVEKTGELGGTWGGIWSGQDFSLVNYGRVGLIHSTGETHIVNAGIITDSVGFGTSSFPHDDTFTNYKTVKGVVKAGTVLGVIDLGGGNDTFLGGAKSETVRDGAGSDTYGFGKGNDVFLAHRFDTYQPDGTDVVNGGGGVDTYDASETFSGVGINLGDFDLLVAAHTATGATIGTDTINGFENAIGGSGADILLGSDGANALTGNGGSDWLFGLGGRDILSGGSGADTFIFSKVSDSKASASLRDVITDYQQGFDIIHLVNIDANGKAPGDGAFDFIGFDKFSGTRGELRQSIKNGDTLVSGDTNGDGKADFAILLKGYIALHDSDFVL
jgi:Ca2+-binding RTX toxin-like protein